MPNVTVQEHVANLKRFVACHGDLLQNGMREATLESIHDRLSFFEAPHHEQAALERAKLAAEFLLAHHSDELVLGMVESLNAQRELLGESKVQRWAGKGLAPEGLSGATIRSNPAAVHALMDGGVPSIEVAWGELERSFVDSILAIDGPDDRAQWALEYVRAAAELAQDHDGVIQFDARSVGGSLGGYFDTVLQALAAFNSSPLAETLALRMVPEESSPDTVFTQLRFLNPGLELKELDGFRGVVLEREDGWGVTLPYPISAVYRDRQKLAPSVEALTGLSKASGDQIIAGLRDAGLNIPQWLGPELLDALEARSPTASLAVTNGLRDALDPLVQTSVQRIHELTPAHIEHALETYETRHQVLEQTYGQPLVDPLNVPASPYSSMAERISGLMEFNGSHLRREDAYDGSFDQYIHSFPREEPTGLWRLAGPQDKGAQVTQVLATAITPIGGYGRDFAHALHLTTQIINESLMDELLQLSPEVFAQHRDLLSSRTARGEESQDRGPAFAVIEGVLSIQQAISQLLAEPIPGFSDPSAALAMLIEPRRPGDPNGVLNRYVQLLSMGMVGPLTMQGKHFANPVTVEDGQLKLSAGLLGQLHDVKADQHDELAAVKPEARHQTGVGCPFAIPASRGEKTGVQALAEVFVETLERVRAELTGADAD